MIFTFKTQIYPNDELKQLFAKAFGTRRFIWNWSLDRYLNNGEYNNFKNAKYLNSIKDEQYPWINEVWSSLRQQVLKDFTLSVNRYHKEQKLARKKSEKIDTDYYKPKFKKKGKDIESFRLDINKAGNASFKRPLEPISKHYIELSGIGNRAKRIKCKIAESVMFLNDKKQYKLCTAAISMKADKYYIAITYEKINHKVKSKYKSNSLVGIDMGVHNPLTMYDNNNDSYVIDIDKNLRKQEKRTEKLNKKLSKKLLKNGNNTKTNNFRKLLIKLQKSYLKENNIKEEFRKYVVNFIVSNYETIKIEGYPINKTFNHNINRSLSRLGLYIFMEHLRFKCKQYGNNLIEIPKGTPTTQTCSQCGNRLVKGDKLGLKDRIYHCKVCNSVLDRDLNAAINIFNFNVDKNIIEVGVTS